VPICAKSGIRRARSAERVVNIQRWTEMAHGTSRHERLPIAADRRSNRAPAHSPRTLI
jgi:hypothetical protein